MSNHYNVIPHFRELFDCPSYLWKWVLLADNTMCGQNAVSECEAGGAYSN